MPAAGIPPGHPAAIVARGAFGCDIALTPLFAVCLRGKVVGRIPRARHPRAFSVCHSPLKSATRLAAALLGMRTGPHPRTRKEPCRHGLA